jgi:hypothetical protein
MHRRRGGRPSERTAAYLHRDRASAVRLCDRALESKDPQLSDWKVQFLQLRDAAEATDPSDARHKSIMEVAASHEWLSPFDRNEAGSFGRGGTDPYPPDWKLRAGLN